MSRYSLFNQKDKLILSYGYDEDQGYYYELWEALYPEDNEARLIESSSVLATNLNPGNLVKILDQWDAPREHLLAISIGMQF